MAPAPRDLNDSWLTRETPETRHEEKYETKSKVQGRSQAPAPGSEMICGYVELIDRLGTHRPGPRLGI